MRVVLDTTHLGAIGGGENYLMRFAIALNELCDFYVCRNWSKEFFDFNGFYKEFKVYDGMFQPDVYIFSSYQANTIPIGKKNVSIDFYPSKQKPSGFDMFVSICDYSANIENEKWGVSPHVIEPCVDKLLFEAGREKRKQIVSIGHFFEEPDGHSKNQHILCEAFTKDIEDLGYELILIGNAHSQDRLYVNKVREAAEGKRIRLEINKHSQFVRDTLAESYFYWHANGYGRTNPSQTEHFGIVVLEAIASKCIPVVHQSGGAREIDGVISWNTPEELTKFTLEAIQDYWRAPRLNERYTVRAFNERVAKWTKSL